jgi:hypothetical protein
MPITSQAQPLRLQALARRAGATSVALVALAVTLTACLSASSPDPTASCDRHVVTSFVGTSTSAGSPADHNAAIWNWVQDRRGDD